MMLPLSEFPKRMQDEIAALVAAPTPPPKWVVFGVPGDAFPLARIRSRAWSEWYRQRGLTPDREPIDAATRQLVIRRDGFVCHLCGGAVKRGDVHLDHVIPRSKGGPDTADNLKVAHSTCNLRKGNRA